MSSRNYIIPVGGMTLTDQKQYRLNAIAAGLELSGDKKIGNIKDEIPGYVEADKSAKTASEAKAMRIQTILNWISQGNTPASIDVRAPQPALDFGVAAALDDWQSAALAVINTFYTVFSGVVAPTLNAVRLAVWYGVALNAPGVPNVSRLTFRSGGALGNLMAEFDLEALEARLETVGFFSEPVIFEPTRGYSATVRCRVVTGAAERVQLIGFLFEPAGTTNA